MYVGENVGKVIIMSKKINVLCLLTILAFSFNIVSVHAQVRDLNNISIPANQVPTAFAEHRFDINAPLAVVVTNWSTPIQGRIWQKVEPDNLSDKYHDLYLNASFNWGNPQTTFGIPTLYLRTKTYSLTTQTMSGKWFY